VRLPRELEPAGASSQRPLRTAPAAHAWGAPCLPPGRRHQPTLSGATVSPTKKMYELFKRLSLGNLPTMRATFTDFKGEHTGSKPAPQHTKRHSTVAAPAADEVLDDPSYGSPALGSSDRQGSFNSSQRRGSEAKGSAQARAYRQPKSLELTVHSFKLNEHDRDLKYLLPAVQLARLSVDAYNKNAKAISAYSNTDFDWAHAYKLTPTSEAHGALKAALFPPHAGGAGAPARLALTAMSDVPANVRKAFEMFDYDRSGDIDARELRKALQARHPPPRARCVCPRPFRC
jgi:hypothetical protein